MWKCNCRNSQVASRVLQLNDGVAQQPASFRTWNRPVGSADSLTPFAAQQYGVKSA